MLPSGMLLRYYTVLYGMSDAKTASVPSVRLFCWRENGCELFLVFAEFDSMDYSSRTLNPPQGLITCLVWWRLTDGLTKGWTAGRSQSGTLHLVATRWDTIVQYGSAFDTFHMDTVTD
jgi:hypothetical protein